MSKRSVDVAIIGNGPAGSTVALSLSKSNLSIALLGLPCHNKKLFGETLPPHIKASLLNLGVWKDFLNDEHLPSTENMSSWGDTEIKEHNFIFHPDTYGWHIDRVKFDLMLLNAAMREGTFYSESMVENIENNCDNIWNLKLRKDKKTETDLLNAKFLVDATGRTSWLSLRLGVSRLVFDNLCGYVSFLLPRSPGDTDSMTLIESVSDGWWYSALLPKNIRVVSFFTNSNLPVARHASKSKGWMRIMQKTIHVKLNIKKYNYEVISGPHIMVSNSSILKTVTGQDWLAVGDASVTFDPVS